MGNECRESDGTFIYKSVCNCYQLINNGDYLITHAPTLNTVMMVEEALKNAKDSAVSIAEIKRMLPKQVNHNTLKTILSYLEESNKIVVSLKGITWIHNPSAKLRKAIAKGMEV